MTIQPASEKYPDLFARYQTLVLEADAAFVRIRSRYPQYVTCRIGCSDCCHAVFGLFFIEAVHIQDHFSRLERKDRRRVIARCGKAQRRLDRFISTLAGGKSDSAVDPVMALGRQRVRCPLLEDDGKCLLYHFRPITCRVYGIPNLIRGKVRTCAKTGFVSGQSYPTFALTEAFGELHALSQACLSPLPGGDPAKADRLISLPAILVDPLVTIIRRDFGWP